MGGTGKTANPVVEILCGYGRMPSLRIYFTVGKTVGLTSPLNLANVHILHQRWYRHLRNTFQSSNGNVTS